LDGPLEGCLSFFLIGSTQETRGPKVLNRVLSVECSEITRPVGIKLGWNVHCMVLEKAFFLLGCTQNKQEAQRCQKGCCLFLISETTGPIGTKIGRNAH
jgi:hypothetical protein